MTISREASLRKHQQIRARYFPDWVPKVHYRLAEEIDYVDPVELYCSGEKGRDPNMHFKSTRDWSKVTCLRCHWKASSTWVKIICFIAAITLYLRSEVKNDN